MNDNPIRTLNFNRIGVSLSCNDLLQSSNASKSIGNLISFKILALTPSLPLYWKRTKFTVKYAGNRLIFDYNQSVNKFAYKIYSQKRILWSHFMVCDSYGSKINGISIQSGRFLGELLLQFLWD